MVDSKDTNFDPDNIKKVLHSLLYLNGGKLHLSIHAKERMAQRSITMSDLLYLLKNGHVEPEREKATLPNKNWEQHKLWKYTITGYTPNSENRELQSIMIVPDAKGGIKIVTVMWKD